MSETPTLGEVLLGELDQAIKKLDTADNELLGAIAAVLRTFLVDYEIEYDWPDCPGCGDIYCPGHGRHSFHTRCGSSVQTCACLQPYLQLARSAAA